VTSPKHIEVQILGDKHGNIVYLMERECSIQRRHQKVIEEAPSAVVSPEIRKKLGESAVNVARSCNYYGAGTVEFIMDADLNFYFLEMNTRLQVEHPVTEMITGIDLVKEQIKIARGEKLSFTQDDLKINGHALELRVYAEDPCNNFLPDIGTLHTYKKPEGNGIRIDDGFEEGMSIPIYYDPMIAKMIVHAPTRKDAIDKMIRAIEEYKIVGVKNTLSFGKFVLQHENFVSGNFDTHFVPTYFKPEYLQDSDADEMKIASWLTTQLMSNTSNKTSESTIASNNESSNWKKNRTSLR
jgi:acetyl/propionyl-CoA carboxylase alpha subunit